MKVIMVIKVKNLISSFRNKSIWQDLCPDVFFPIDKLHITLLKIKFENSILDIDVFSTVSKFYKITAKEFAGKTIRIKSGRYFTEITVFQ